MELHPILESDVIPNKSLWYVISAFGDRPSLRVGHTGTPIGDQGEDKKTQKVVFVGGANPDETFTDVHILDFETLSWNLVCSSDFVSRYEHIAFNPSSQPNKIYTLGGANKESNLGFDCVQCYDVPTEQWSTVNVTGPAPTGRTLHTTAQIANCTYIFSGGKISSEPIQDRQVHCFDATTNSWTSLAVSGDIPSPRHGHSLTAIGKKVYCFGGMAGTKFYNDVHVIDVEKGTWTTPKIKKRNIPEPRAAHAAVANGSSLYIFGGINKTHQALDDLWELDTFTMQWSLCPNEGPPPACRLDMAACVITWSPSAAEGSKDDESELAASVEKVQFAESYNQAEGASAQPPTAADSDVHKLLLIHGGMDTEGEFFDDCLVYRLN